MILDDTEDEIAVKTETKRSCLVRLVKRKDSLTKFGYTILVAKLSHIEFDEKRLAFKEKKHKDMLHKRKEVREEPAAAQRRKQI